jgi:hypothetical protein
VPSAEQLKRVAGHGGIYGDCRFVRGRTGRGTQREALMLKLSLGNDLTALLGRLEPA